MENDCSPSKPFTVEDDDLQSSIYFKGNPFYFAATLAGDHISKPGFCVLLNMAYGEGQKDAMKEALDTVRRLQS